MKAYYRKQKTSGSKAQAIVEFAIVLPILMMILVGIFEVGRLLFIYSAVTNASREAARFGSALGYDDDGYHKYKDCSGIRNMARRSAYFLNLADADISITYDHGPSTSSFVVCDQSSGEDPNVVVNSGSDQDRILVTITASYNPLIRLIPIPSRTITSSSARTILGYVDIGSSSGGGGGGGGSSTATATVTGTLPTAAPSDTATATMPTNTPTKTATSAPTLPATSFPTTTPTLVPTSTKTATPTLTKTSTPTMTLTPTQTNTPTAVSSCSSITASNINVTDGSTSISMTITNPYTAVTVSSISLQWNNLGAQSGSPKTLTLDSANLGATFWSGINNSSGSYTITPASTLTIPGNNTTTTITFTFIQAYKASSMSGKTTITINLSTAGCSAITKTY